MKVTFVAEYHELPAEGINVVSKALVDGLRAEGVEVELIDPKRMLWSLLLFMLSPVKMIVFTHGPGPRTVLVSALLRWFTNKKIVWVATRPDLGGVHWSLRGLKTAHVVICNRPRDDLSSVAMDAEIISHPIGISPRRITSTSVKRWHHTQAPIAVHVGHLRATRGLNKLCEIKRSAGDRIEVIVVASPYFEPDPKVVSDLHDAGVVIDRGLIEDIGSVYNSADLYLFTPPAETEGAIELPLSVLEALACKRPVVSTPFGALPEVLHDTPGVKFADGNDFVNAVLDWLEDPTKLPSPKGLPDKLNVHSLTGVLHGMIKD